ncbi:MAG: hypothetical protein HY909_18210 [Deltaproteobacteria bacterium]|nr:hypothetical protein [Deltaproteobacteria bacterium]
MKRDLDTVGLVALLLGYSAAALLVPDFRPLELLLEPTIGAVAGTAALVTVVVVQRSKGRRGSLLERRVMAAFLALMPTVYLSSWHLHHGAGGWLGLELLGLGVFAALAWWGLKRSPWVLAAGIAAHGVLWDSWHLGRQGFIADWYVVACVVVDLAFGFYVATQARAFTEALQGSAPGSAAGPRPGSAG